MLNRLKDVFRCLEERKVRYLVIGGIATVLHGVPRATFDLDILIDPTEENARRLLDAILDAGLATAADTTPAEILDYEITVFEDLVRVDVQTETPGIEFEPSWQRRATLEYRDQEVQVVSREDLIRAKRAAGREVDLKDARLLENTQ
jgi:hypothetical protein